MPLGGLEGDSVVENLLAALDKEESAASSRVLPAVTGQRLGGDARDMSGVR